MNVVSPCIKVCRMDEAYGLCLGCARTLDEIVRWNGMNDSEKARVLAALPARKERLVQREASERQQ
jgi:uncharacterized protein